MHFSVTPMQLCNGCLGPNCTTKYVQATGEVEADLHMFRQILTHIAKGTINTFTKEKVGAKADQTEAQFRCSGVTSEQHCTKSSSLW